MCVVNLKVFSVLFIVYLTIFCFSCQSSRSEIGLSPQWSSSPLMYLHNFHHQSLYCQPDLSQVLGKAILVASRNAVQCHCWALLQHCHGPTGGMRPAHWLGCSECCWSTLGWTKQCNTSLYAIVALVGVLRFYWFGFGGGFLVSVLGSAFISFSHVVSRTMCPAENCRLQFGLSAPKRASSSLCLHVTSSVRRTLTLFLPPLVRISLFAVFKEAASAFPSLPTQSCEEKATWYPFSLALPNL